MAAEVSKQFLCRFFERGDCRNGDNCEFSHDTQSKRLPEDACIYHILNKCIFGDQCRYIHLQINDSSERAVDETTTTNNLPYLDEEGQQNESEIEANTSQHYYDVNLIYNEDERNEHDDDENEIHDQQNEAEEDEEELVVVEEEEEDSDEQQVEEEYQGENDLNYDLYYDNNGYEYENYECEDQEAINTNETTMTINNQNENKSRSYADVVKIDDEESSHLATLPLCPFGVENEICPKIETCTYVHGNRCEYCNRLCLHPYNEELRKRHHEECVLEHEREMERSFAIKQSMDKACGICMDIIMEKEPDSERRFGILEKCSHVFCLSCIRKWRQTKQFDNKTIRACPECRVASDFVVPNKFWVDSPDEKKRLIDTYKKNLSEKPCKYFQQDGTCPFGGACFYLHASPDGTRQQLPQPRARRRQNQYGNSEEIRDFFLFNYLEAREDRQLLLQLELEDFIHEMIYSDDDDFDDDWNSAFS